MFAERRPAGRGPRDAYASRRSPVGYPRLDVYPVGERGRDGVGHALRPARRTTAASAAPATWRPDRARRDVQTAIGINALRDPQPHLPGQRAPPRPQRAPGGRLQPTDDTGRRRLHDTSAESTRDPSRRTRPPRPPRRPSGRPARGAPRRHPRTRSGASSGTSYGDQVSAKRGCAVMQALDLPARLRHEVLGRPGEIRTARLICRSVSLSITWKLQGLRCHDGTVCARLVAHADSFSTRHGEGTANPRPLRLTATRGIEKVVDVDEGGSMRRILQTCVEIDTLARDTYAEMAERCAADPTSPSGSRRMAADEGTHLTWWKELLRAWDEGLLPDIAASRPSSAARLAGMLEDMQGVRAAPPVRHPLGRGCPHIADRLELSMLDPCFGEFLDLMEPAHRHQAARGVRVAHRTSRRRDRGPVPGRLRHRGASRRRSGGPGATTGGSRPARRTTASPAHNRRAFNRT